MPNLRSLLTHLRMPLALAVATLVLVSTDVGTGVGPLPPVGHTASATPSPSPTPPAPVPERRTVQPLRILFLGASITSGFFSTGTASAYPAVVVDRLRARGDVVQPTVFAQPGVEVGQTLAWPVPAGQNVVVVQLITNDFWHSVPLSTYRDGYDQLLTRIQTASPRARLVCLGSWDRSQAVNQRGLSASAYDATTRTSCQRRAGVYVPLAQLYAQAAARGPAGVATPFGTADEVHPNDSGQGQIAAAVLAGLDGEAAPE